MAKKKTIELTDDVLALISNIHFGELPYTKDMEMPTYGIDMNSVFGGMFMLTDIAYILGLYDKYVIIGTEENSLGPEFKKEAADYFFMLGSYIYENLEDIETLVHYFSNKGGLKAGIYEYSRKTGLWSFKEELNNDNSNIYLIRKTIDAKQ